MLTRVRCTVWALAWILGVSAALAEVLGASLSLSRVTGLGTREMGLFTEEMTLPTGSGWVGCCGGFHGFGGFGGFRGRR